MHLLGVECCLRRSCILIFKVTVKAFQEITMKIKNISKGKCSGRFLGFLNKRVQNVDYILESVYTYKDVELRIFLTYHIWRINVLV